VSGELAAARAAEDAQREARREAAAAHRANFAGFGFGFSGEAHQANKTSKQLKKQQAKNKIVVIRFVLGLLFYSIIE
jgi:regulator of protease activity HflC (stomatin/prohibitin superfamily)